MSKKLTFFIPLIFILAACQPALATPVLSPSSTPAPSPTPTQQAQPPSPAPPPAASPTPQQLRISSQDGMTQLFVPAGTFIMGGMDILMENDELPAHQVTLNAFWIDQVEVTTGMYALCVAAGGCRLPVKSNSDDHTDYYGNPLFRDYPVVHVTWYDANTYCQWAGRRLPTEAEWERAASGDDLRNYPWGNEPPNAENANAKNLVGDVTRVGSYAAGASLYGALDMGGNVWEWVSDYYRQDYYKSSPPLNPIGPLEGGLRNLRVIRGGSYQDNQFGMRTSNRGFEEGPDLSTLGAPSAFYGRSSVKIGFRCAANP